MKKIMGYLTLLLVSITGFADDAPPMVLDKVMFQVSEKQWVTTHTALLSVTINMTLKSPDLVKARDDIMGSLNKVAKGEWHILAFDRSQDSSGLEKLYVQAQARVDQSALTDIYKNAKSVSVPGAQYDISSVEFKPSLQEVQMVRAKIRDALYQRVNEEMARINKANPNQNYSINKLMFLEGAGVPAPRAYQAKEMNVALMSADISAPVSVSNELTLTAVVEAASIRK